MAVRTELEWSYKPKDFFEGRFVLGLLDGELTADDGKAVLTLTSPTDPILASGLQKFKDEVSNVFEVRQLLKHRPFELNGPNIIQHLPEGGRSTSVAMAGVSCIVKARCPDIVTRDADGNITSDTKADRLESEMNMMNSLLPKALTSPILLGMLRSYGQAVRDPRNELVHLYEIRDAIANLYGGENGAKTALGINPSDWSTLGGLANHEPLREGRHRGKKIDELRSATQEELAEARRIAFNLIKAHADMI